MMFYIAPVILLALAFDIPITVFLVKKFPSGRIYRWFTPYFPVLFYFVSALIWVGHYGRDARFQGQGVIGLAMFLGVGVISSCLRLGVGLIFTSTQVIKSQQKSKTR